ncbi:33521_t:CDS:2, partial [Racocetra persica]
GTIRLRSLNHTDTVNLQQYYNEQRSAWSLGVRILENGLNFKPYRTFLEFDPHTSVRKSRSRNPDL